MTIKTWNPRPLYAAVVDLLERKGPMTDEELYGLLKEDREDIGFGDLNRTLMKMEIEGKVHVSALARGRRRVELVKDREASP